MILLVIFNLRQKGQHTAAKISQIPAHREFSKFAYEVANLFLSFKALFFSLWAASLAICRHKGAKLNATQLVMHLRHILSLLAAHHSFDMAKIAVGCVENKVVTFQSSPIHRPHSHQVLVLALEHRLH